MQEVHDFCGQHLNMGFKNMQGMGRVLPLFEETEFISRERAAECKAEGRVDLAAVLELLCDREIGYCL